MKRFFLPLAVVALGASSFAAGLAIGPIDGGDDDNSVVVFNDQLVTMTSNVLNGADMVTFEVLDSNNAVAYSGASPVDEFGQSSFTWIPLFDGTFTVNATSYFDGQLLGTESVSFGQVVRPDASGFITGGGWFNQGPERDNFGFVAQVLGNGTVRGSMEFQDRNNGLNIKSTSVDWVYSPDVRNGYFTGWARMNNAGNYRFMVHVIDNGEPGSEDWLEMWVYNPDSGALMFQYSGVLDGGNVQVKKK
ncbi:MAG: hypothetical protein KF812_02505 [Fimbriimonadaceae bacterium]|nr:hypothetical protein [Fimbriimonadaceae bacterium]